MQKRALFIFMVVFGLMVAGAGIYAFASESNDDAAASASDDPAAVLVQEGGFEEDEVDDKDLARKAVVGPHGELLDEVLDELVAAGTLDEPLADEIRAAFEAKLDEKLGELKDGTGRRGFGGFLGKGGEFDLENLPKWLEGLELDEELLRLFEDGLTPEEMHELKGLLPDGFKPGRGFRGLPFGSLDEFGIDVEELMEDGRIDAAERELIHEMLEEQFGADFDRDFRGFGGRFGPHGPGTEDAEAFFGIRVGHLEA